MAKTAQQHVVELLEELFGDARELRDFLLMDGTLAALVKALPGEGEPLTRVAVATVAQLHAAELLDEDALWSLVEIEFLFKVPRVREVREAWRTAPREIPKPDVPQGSRPALDQGRLDEAGVSGTVELLKPEYGKVGFAGRAALLDALQAWAEDEEAGRLWLIHGAGGMGKTRLAQRWIQRLEQAGREAWFVRGALTEDAALWMLSQPQAAFVIDYAESRPGTRRLVEALAQRYDDAPHVLLLARNAGSWWQDLRSGAHGSRTERLLARSPEPHHLDALTTRGERVAEFRRAFLCFAGEGASPGDEPSLADPRFERVLYIHAAALLRALDPAAALDATQIMSSLLAHEERFWTRTAGLEDAARRGLRRCMAALTLRGGARDDAELAALFQRIAPEIAGPVQRLVSTLYLRDPGATVPEGLAPDTDTPKAIAPLEPDLLGEELVRSVLADPLTPKAWLEDVFLGADAQDVETAFIVMGRVELEHPELTRPWLRRALEPALPERALPAMLAALAVGRGEAPGLAQVLTEVVQARGDVELAMSLEAKLPSPEHTLGLRELVLWVRQTLLPLDADEIVRAQRLSALATGLVTMGRFEEAAAAEQEAVDLLRPLVAKGIEDAAAPLANALAGLGLTYARLGRLELAVEAGRASSDLLRGLMAAKPGAYVTAYVTSLSNLGVHLSSLGKYEEALATQMRAVGLRRLIAEQTGGDKEDLAIALNGLSSTLHALGRMSEAAEASLEATDLYWHLAERKPDAYLERYTLCLSNLGSLLRETRGAEAALPIHQEVVTLYRSLVKRNPGAFLPALGSALGSMGIDLSRMGHHTAALSATEESVRILRSANAASADAHLHNYTVGLGHRGIALGAAGHHAEAIVVGREEIANYRDLAARYPDAFLPKLAQALTNHGLDHWRAGDRDGAARISRQALETIFPLFERAPASYRAVTQRILIKTFKLHQQLVTPGWLADYRDRFNALATPPE